MHKGEEAQQRAWRLFMLSAQRTRRARCAPPPSPPGQCGSAPVQRRQQQEPLAMQCARTRMRASGWRWTAPAAALQGHARRSAGRAVATGRRGQSAQGPLTVRSIAAWSIRTFFTTWECGPSLNRSTLHAGRRQGGRCGEARVGRCVLTAPAAAAPAAARGSRQQAAPPAACPKRARSPPHPPQAGDDIFGRQHVGRDGVQRVAERHDHNREGGQRLPQPAAQVLRVHWEGVGGAAWGEAQPFRLDRSLGGTSASNSSRLARPAPSLQAQACVLPPNKP